MKTETTKTYIEEQREKRDQAIKINEEYLLWASQLIPSDQRRYCATCGDETMVDMRQARCPGADCCDCGKWKLRGPSPEQRSTKDVEMLRTLIEGRLLPDQAEQEICDKLGDDTEGMPKPKAVFFALPKPEPREE